MDFQMEDISINQKKAFVMIAAETGLDESYTPYEDEPYMNPRQLEYFRKRLLFWREQILRESMASLDQLKKYDWKETDVLDQGFQEMATSMRMRISDRSLSLIHKIDEALGRIEEGTYGFCEETGEEIGSKRLEAYPVATLSLEAQKLREIYEKKRYQSY